MDDLMEDMFMCIMIVKRTDLSFYLGTSTRQNHHWTITIENDNYTGQGEWGVGETPAV